MIHSVSHLDVGGTYVSNYTVTRGPANSAVIQTIGSSNPNLAITGLCSNLLTDALIIRMIGVTDATGAITTNNPTLSALVANNSFGGAILYTQCHALDLGRPDPIGICNSDGRMTTVPMPNLTRTNKTARIYSNVGGATVTEGAFVTSSFGYALATEFTY
jgi:hypothetical protein